jgi:hypothetical protein
VSTPTSDDVITPVYELLLPTEDCAEDRLEEEIS